MAGEDEAFWLVPIEDPGASCAELCRVVRDFAADESCGLSATAGLVEPNGCPM